MGIRRPLEKGDGWAVIVLVSGRGNSSQGPKPLPICPDCAYGQILGVTSDQYVRAHPRGSGTDGARRSRRARARRPGAAPLLRPLVTLEPGCAGRIFEERHEPVAPRRSGGMCLTVQSQTANRFVQKTQMFARTKTTDRITWQ